MFPSKYRTPIAHIDFGPIPEIAHIELKCNISEQNVTFIRGMRDFFTMGLWAMGVRAFNQATPGLSLGMYIVGCCGTFVHEISTIFLKRMLEISTL